MRSAPRRRLPSRKLGAPDRPLASRKQESLVLVSPSTVIMLKQRSTARFSALRAKAGSSVASVPMKASMVAMLGWIMPTPLVIAPMRTSRPPISSATAHSFGRRVGGHDRLRGGVAAVGADLDARQAGADLVHGQRHADDARRGDQHQVGCDAELLRRRCAAISRASLEALGAVARVGVARVEHDRLGAARARRVRG